MQPSYISIPMYVYITNFPSSPLIIKRKKEIEFVVSESMVVILYASFQSLGHTTILVHWVGLKR